MKRVAASIVLLIFAASTVRRTVERTEAWAAQYVFKSKHLFPSGPIQPVAEFHKQNPKEKQTKLLQDGWGLHVSFVRCSNTPPSTNALAHPLTGFVADLNQRALCSRAPPSLLS